jgi:glycosyltransferase involved in cell wall biosynthesis
MHCDAKIFIMGPVDSQTTEQGLNIVYGRSSNVLSGFGGILPRQLVTMMWRSGIRDWLAAERPDVVHLHNPHPPGAILQASRACRELNIPYVISTHGFVEFDNLSRAIDAPAWQAPIFERLIRKPVVETAQAAARILTLSPEDEPILVRMGVPAERLTIVPNGTDPYFAEPLPDHDRRRLVSRFALPERKPLLLFVGNHTANKGLDILLSSLSFMKEDAVAVIAGAIRSKSENAALLEGAGIRQGDPRVRFTDFVTKEELRALYRTVDIFVFPTRADTLPLVILEAMSCGLPVVATRVGGIPFEVNQETGILVEPGDPSAIATAVDRLCADPQQRRKMGEAGRDRVIKTFCWETSAEKAVKVYDEVVSQRRTRAAKHNDAIAFWRTRGLT